MKRIIRSRRLTPEEAAKFKKIRKQVEQELPELIARHHALKRVAIALPRSKEKRHVE